MKKLLFGICLLLFNNQSYADTWPNVAIDLFLGGTYSTTSGNVNQTFTNLSTKSFVRVNVTSGDTWTFTGSGSGFTFSVFPSISQPSPGTSPSTTSTGTLSLTTSGIYYILCTFSGPPNRTLSFVGTAGVLAVELTNFTVKETLEHTICEWRVSNENSIIRYEVERSKDAKMFETIASIDAGNYQKWYRCEIENNPSFTYFRLKINGINEVSYTAIIPIRKVSYVSSDQSDGIYSLDGKKLPENYEPRTPALFIKNGSVSLRIDY